MITLLHRIKTSARKIFNPESDSPVYNAIMSAADKTLHCLNAIPANNHNIRSIKIHQLCELGFDLCNGRTFPDSNHRMLMVTSQLVSRLRHYAMRYPQNKFVFFKQVDQICNQFGYMCLPADKFVGIIPDRVTDHILDFKADPEDIWYSNYARNIIEFNTLSEAVRVSLAGVDPDNGGNGFEKIKRMKLNSLPAYLCMSRDWFSGRAEINKPYECILLHPLPDGFLIITNWNTIEK